VYFLNSAVVTLGSVFYPTLRISAAISRLGGFLATTLRVLRGGLLVAPQVYGPALRYRGHFRGSWTRCSASSS